ncbi:MAG: hypothetical protein M1837_001687 [Sclerophora amabilis]|nr:MAG: hypothetical protein M1837_001687 [Sclerophora amabilis]
MPQSEFQVMDKPESEMLVDHAGGQQDRKTAQNSRSRSNTSNSIKSRRRPQSRASTTSVHSVSTQQSHPHAHERLDFQGQNQSYNQGPLQYSPEGILLQSAQHLTDPHGFPLDPSLEGSVHNGIPYASGTFRNQNPLVTGEYPSFDDADSQMLDNGNDGPPENTPDPSDAKALKPQKKSSGSSAQNELELKRLFRENSSRSLREVADQLHVDERGPQSERIRQIFAMLWLNVACKKTVGSVPRGRVYSHYVSRCGTERVTVLNPASFGKLVRVMFPGIATRRLGMRGESKYHYCGLSLIEDQPNLAASSVNIKNNQQNSLFQQPEIGPGEPTQNPELPADTAVFPASSTVLDSKKRQSKMGPKKTSTSLFCDTSMSTISPISPDSPLDMIERELSFASTVESAIRENEPIDLPRIDLYTPPGTDPDTAAALTALYRSNCTSLIDAMRFCRQKPFFHLFTSFHGTLTVPVHKLLTNPALAPWIRECDWLMYQKMIHVMAPLALQVIPKRVVDTLQIVSKELVSHIRSSFNSNPPHVLEAKLGPATMFASLIDRLLRVNMAAHAAASILCNNATRDQMYEEWTKHVDPYRVVQNELPNCGYAQVLAILSGEVRELLEPVSVNWELPGSENGYQQHDSNPGASTEGLLDRWASFVIGLPDRFPRADVRTILTCVNVVTTAALRDITMGSGKSFGAWWICKMWIDEMMGWMAEKGGFMEHSAQLSLEERQDLATDATSDGYSNGNGHQSSRGSHAQSRFSSVGAEFANPLGQGTFDSSNHFSTSTDFQDPFQQGPGDSHHQNQDYNNLDFTKRNSATSSSASLRMGNEAALADASGLSKEPGHDDSGIGLHDDLSMTRFSFETTANVAAAGSNNAPTATGSNGDVVVC